jgi:hypothetical protein
MPEVFMPVLRTLLALLVCASVGLPDELRTLSGQKHTGQLVSVTDKQMEFKTATDTVKVPVAQVLDVKLNPVKGLAADTRRIDFELTDGSVLHCKPDGFTAKGTKVELTLLSGQVLKLGIKDIGYFLRDAQDAGIQKRFRTILRKKVKSDRILGLVGDKEAKKGELNALNVTIGDADAEGKTIAYRTEEGEKATANLKRVYGMIFYRPNPNALPTVCQLQDTDGNLLMANKVAALDGAYKITTVAGATINYEKAAVAQLDYNINKLNYLSDLEPIKVVEKSISGLITRYRKDKNLDNDAIRIKGKTYAKGISMHAYTELEYDLKGKYKELRFTLGVDDQVGGNSKAVVTVTCDGTKVFTQEVNRAKEPKEVVVKVKDVESLKITVSSNNILDLHDHATLADAKVSQ